MHESERSISKWNRIGCNRFTVHYSARLNVNHLWRFNLMQQCIAAGMAQFVVAFFKIVRVQSDRMANTIECTQAKGKYTADIGLSQKYHIATAWVDFPAFSLSYSAVIAAILAKALSDFSPWRISLAHTLSHSLRHGWRAHEKWFPSNLMDARVFKVIFIAILLWL